MDKFKNRIKYYLVGLSFGLILVYFMFGNRGCSWLPSNRVKNMIGEKEIVIGDSILDVLSQLELNNDDIYALLKSDGDVDFSLSKTEGVPKVYYLSGEKESDTYSAKFALYEEKKIAEVVALSRGDRKASSTLSNKYKSTLPLPHNDVIAILESHEFRILAKAECDMAFYTISEEDLFKFHTTATIDIGKSEPRLSPNPFYVMKGQLNGATYEIVYIVGENRTRIESIKGEQISDCSESN